MFQLTLQYISQTEPKQFKSNNYAINNYSKIKK